MRAPSTTAGHPEETPDGGAAGDRGGDGPAGMRGSRGRRSRCAGQPGPAERETAPTVHRPTPTSTAPSTTTGPAEGDLRRRRSGRPRRRRGRAGSSVHADDERRAIGATRRRRSGRPWCRRAWRTRRRPLMRSAGRLGQPGVGAKRGQPQDATRSDGRTAARKVDLAVGATRPQADRTCKRGAPRSHTSRGPAPCSSLPSADAAARERHGFPRCDLPHATGTRMRAPARRRTVPA